MKPPQAAGAQETAEGHDACDTTARHMLELELAWPPKCLGHATAFVTREAHAMQQFIISSSLGENVSVRAKGMSSAHSCPPAT